MSVILNFLASKVAAPVLLAICILLTVSVGVQTVRINGVSLFGWHAVEGYKAKFEALQSQNLADKLARAEETISEISELNAALSKSNASNHADALHWQSVASDLQKKASTYVPKEIATACVPVGLVELLDAAGTGATLPEIDESARKSLSTCSGIPVSQAADTLVYDLGLIPVLSARIENARRAWEEQQMIVNSMGQK